ncbi:protein-lysine N-methyltransferase EEF2KMT-like [Sycon ciliatum]|uniref:protein-lysine N-methyltransferase EEF2KMT-like n=1 Tax=Sycon ciliatum TaxID=27933 RepID=UPI0031F68278
MEAIQEQYMALVPMRMFDWQSVTASLDESTQLDILARTCQHPLCQRYPASSTYRQAFLKVLMNKCERSGHDIAEDLYVAYTDTLNTPANATTDKPGTNKDQPYRIYMLREYKHCPIVLQESDSFVSQGTTGLQTWPAAVHLVEWMLDNQEVFNQRDVLELGCGIGLVGCALSQWCGRAHVTTAATAATSCHPTPSTTAQMTSSAAPMTSPAAPMASSVAPMTSSATPVTSCPSRITLTDHHPGVLRQLAANVARNLGTQAESVVASATSSKPLSPEAGKSGSGHYDDHCFTAAPLQLRAHSDSDQSSGTDGASVTTIAELNWCDIDEEGTASHRLMTSLHPDIILAADVVFDKAIVPSLVATLHTLLTHQQDRTDPHHLPTTAIVSCTIRNEDTFQCFLTAIDKHGLCWCYIDVSENKRLWCDRTVPVRLVRITAATAGTTTGAATATTAATAGTTTAASAATAETTTAAAPSSLQP